MARFYLASSYLNKQSASEAIATLQAEGHVCTFDWAALDDEGDLADIAFLEAAAILYSEVLILLLPGRLGSHVEFGIAIGAGVPVVVVGSTKDVDCIFYHLPNVSVMDRLPLLQPDGGGAAERSRDGQK